MGYHINVVAAPFRKKMECFIKRSLFNFYGKIKLH